MIKVWILILTLNGTGTASQHMGAIDHLPPFSSEEECEVAGAKWVKKASPGWAATAVCVSQTVPGSDVKVSMTVPQNPTF